MKKTCPICGKENTIGALWCYHCNNKLYRTVNEPLEEKPIEDNMQPTESSRIPLHSKQISFRDLFKLFLLVIITISILLTFFTLILSNLAATSELDEIITHLNNDFYYNDGQIITADGKTYKIFDIQDYQLNGKITDVTTQTKKPGQPSSLSFFQPFEFLTHLFTQPTEDINHNHLLTAYIQDKLINWQIECNQTDNEITYNNTNYIIPLNENIRKQLQENISVDDDVIIQGTIVNIQPLDEPEPNQESTTDTQTQTTNQKIIIVKNISITNSK